MKIRFEKAFELIESALSKGRHVLLESESMTLMAIIGIPVPTFQLATSVEEAQKIAEAFGYPIVLKVVSPDIMHKTDVGGVKLGIINSNQIAEKFKEIRKSVKEKVPDARITGIIVHKMQPSTIEVAIGAVRDRQFGPVVMFGLGGVFIELLKDTSFRIIPISKVDALEMIQETKGYPLLIGYRGSPKLDLNSITDALVRVSELMTYIKEIDQIDLNPIMVYQFGLIAVSARIILT